MSETLQALTGDSYNPSLGSPRSNFRKVTITLPPEHESFLADFALNLRTEGGRKLATTEIVRGLILALQEIDLDRTEIRTEEELAKRLLRALPKIQNGNA